MERDWQRILPGRNHTPEQRDFSEPFYQRMFDNAQIDLADKEAVLAAGTPVFFTIPHFDGYSAVLIQLSEVSTKDLREALVDGGLACAPAALADEYLAR